MNKPHRLKRSAGNYTTSPQDPNPGAVRTLAITQREHPNSQDLTVDETHVIAAKQFVEENKK